MTGESPVCIIFGSSLATTVAELLTTSGVHTVGRAPLDPDGLVKYVTRRQGDLQLVVFIIDELRAFEGVDVAALVASVNDRCDVESHLFATEAKASTEGVWLAAYMQHLSLSVELTPVRVAEGIKRGWFKEVNPLDPNRPLRVPHSTFGQTPSPEEKKAPAVVKREAPPPRPQLVQPAQAPTPQPATLPPLPRKEPKVEPAAQAPTPPKAPVPPVVAQKAPLKVADPAKQPTKPESKTFRLSSADDLRRIAKLIAAT